MPVENCSLIFYLLMYGNKEVIERMITIMKKYEIINLKLQGWSNLKIQKTFGVSRGTVRKYWKEYQNGLEKLKNVSLSEDARQLIEELVSNPTYDTSNRKPRKYNEEVDSLLDKILADEELKAKRLGNRHKQKLTQAQIHQLILDAGYDISRTTIQTHINEKRNKHNECFIKQEYPYGQRFEYDFGEVKLIIGDKLTKGFLAVITAPASKFRWAYLYHNSKMDVFLDSQVKFFEMLGGSFSEGVYDNMKNVVTKFIGRNEKQLNEQLIKLATYYGFSINVTNCFSGNEKGFVESSVKWIRNKVFATKYEFDSFEIASDYLQERLKQLNKDSLIEEEKKHLNPYRPKYEVASISVNNVDKYSFITVDNNYYSVPEELVGKNVIVKKYPNTIYIYYKNNEVAKHIRLTGKKKTCIDIKHYLNTFLRKPGAIRNSAALNSVPRLKDIFDTYYKDNPKSFIDLLYINKDLSLEELIDNIDPRKAITNPSNWIEEETYKQIQSVNSLFIGGYNVH